jgi:hypothetical protein
MSKGVEGRRKKVKRGREGREGRSEEGDSKGR